LVAFSNTASEDSARIGEYGGSVMAVGLHPYTVLGTAQVTIVGCVWS
jgi:hypothetical protein